MSDAPNAIANTEDFEFAALNEARNYRQALVEEFKPYLRGNVIEIGAGVGQMTRHFKELPDITRLVSIEPDSSFCRQNREELPGHELIEGTIENAPTGFQADAIVSINVLEHIGADREELARYAQLLRERHGHVCLFVPARPEIYAPIDKDFGHFRRYTKPLLRDALESAGSEIVRLHYYNFVGYFLWWMNFRILKQRTLRVPQVRLYDKRIFPVVHTLEKALFRPPIGQSLLAVARAV